MPNYRLMEEIEDDYRSDEELASPQSLPGNFRRKSPRSVSRRVHFRIDLNRDYGLLSNGAGESLF